MLNIMSYVGMSLQAEVCLWTLLGLVRTIFDATLFKVNANLKQVWQMKMPPQLSMSVQRVLRTMISGVMLVQCFTLYVYLAFYIVLLYPVFLEERPTLVLPWLLLAAIRKLLCELTSLALGLGTCVLLGPGRPACVRFLITKVFTIAPAFYVWLLVFSYYHTLKMTTAFKTFPAVMPPADRDFGLELAVRRRRTKSLFGEEQLRRKIKAGLYAERTLMTTAQPQTHLKFNEMIRAVPSNESDNSKNQETGILCPISVTSNRTESDVGFYEDCARSDVAIPRDTDRILEQFVTMSLRIATYLNRDGTSSSKFLDSLSMIIQNKSLALDCNALSSENSEPPQLIRSIQGRGTSYLTDYPLIFMKKISDVQQHPKIEQSEIMTRATESKAVGSNDTLSCNKSIIFSEKSTFLELNNSKNSHESDRILPFIEKNTNKNENEPDTQLEKMEINNIVKIESTENLKNIDKNVNNLSNYSITKEDDESQEGPNFS